MEPATLAELKAKFPNSTADWRESQLEAGADLPASAIAYASFVETNAKKTNEALQKQVEELTAKVKIAPTSSGKGTGNSLGQQPLKSAVLTGAEAEELELESGDAVQDFNSAVERIAGRSPSIQKRQTAIRVVARQKPDLYKSYMLATNPGKRHQRLIDEKLTSAN